MPSYRVSFINEIARDDKVFRCVQRSIVIPSAESGASAVEAAKKQFARLEGVRDWHVHAHRIEVCPVPARSGREAEADDRRGKGRGGARRSKTTEKTR